MQSRCEATLMERHPSVVMTDLVLTSHVSSITGPYCRMCVANIIQSSFVFKLVTSYLLNSLLYLLKLFTKLLRLEDI